MEDTNKVRVWWKAHRGPFGMTRGNTLFVIACPLVIWFIVWAYQQ